MVLAFPLISFDVHSSRGNLNGGTLGFGRVPPTSGDSPEVAARESRTRLYLAARINGRVVYSESRPIPLHTRRLLKPPSLDDELGAN
jgi:hypothetical protein